MIGSQLRCQRMDKGIAGSQVTSVMLGKVVPPRGGVTNIAGCAQETPGNIRPVCRGGSASFQHRQGFSDTNRVAWLWCFLEKPNPLSGVRHATS